MKMKVAVIIPRLDLLGPVMVMQNMVNSLIVNDNLSIEVFYIDRNVSDQAKFSVPVKKLDTQKFFFADYDIVHTNGIRPDMFAFLNRRKIKYHISTLHNFIFDDLAYRYNKLFSWFFGYIWLLLLKRADKVACVSYTAKTYYLKWFPSSRLEVIYNGISEADNSFHPDFDVIRSIQSLRDNGLKILGCTGNLTRIKGIDQIIHLISTEKKLGLVIIGDGKEILNLIRLSEKLKIADRCVFCGKRENAVVYFRNFDFFI